MPAFHAVTALRRPDAADTLPTGPLSASPMSELGAPELVQLVLSALEDGGTLIILANTKQRSASFSPISLGSPEPSSPELILDVTTHAVLCKGQEIRVSEREFRLLSLLAERPPRAWPYSTLLRELWGEEYSDHDIVLVKSAIKRLREKMRKAGLHSGIKSVPGYGACLDPEVSSACISG